MTLKFNLVNIFFFSMEMKSMMIDDIPKESINDNQNIFFEEQEDSTEVR